MFGWKWAAEAFDDYLIREDEGYGWHRGPAQFSCRYCGRYPLTWGNKSGSWRPYENGKPHVCPKPPASSEFTPIQVPEI